LESLLPDDIQVKRIVGGLAPDSDAPMPEAVQSMVQQNWKKIASVIPGTTFNFDFWTLNQPRRSTYPSCRAVIAARYQHADFEKPMITAIQKAYYLNAKNPSDQDILIALAGDIGCDIGQFKADLNSSDLEAEFQSELRFCHQVGVRGFPSLLFHSAKDEWSRVSVDYTSPDGMLAQIKQLNVH